MKKIFTLVLILIFKLSFSQDYFQGEIDYRFEVEKKDPTFDLNSFAGSAKKARIFFNNGSFIQRPESGAIEFQYFNRTLNQIFYKLKGRDTLIYYNYKERITGQDSILSIKTVEKSDTILGKICNRLILQTKTTRLSFIYSPSIRTNPDWYKSTKGGYYNIIYGLTKSYYLMFIIETDQYISKGIATKIIPSQISTSSFPDLRLLPKIEL